MREFILQAIIIFISLFIISCIKTESTEPIELDTFSMEEENGFSLSNTNALIIENLRGGTIIYGSTEIDTISYTLSKTIKAKTREKAQINFDKIQLVTNMKNDSLDCSVLYPFDTDYLQSYAYLDMNIPYTIPCTIRNMVEGIFVFHMWNELTVRNAKDHIEIWGHNGSCDVHTLKGRIKIDIALPDSGFCKAITDQGDIGLTISSQTSAIIYAETRNGNITYENLNFSGLIQSQGQLTGTLGTGKGEIWLETGSGNIKIRGI